MRKKTGQNIHSNRIGRSAKVYPSKEVEALLEVHQTVEANQREWIAEDQNHYLIILIPKPDT